MRLSSRPDRALLPVLALVVSPAAAAADEKLVCVPESLALCTAIDRCRPQTVTAEDKKDVMLIDFAAKSAAYRKDGKVYLTLDIVEDRREGARRVLAIQAKNAPDTRADLELEGRTLSILLDKIGSKATLLCAPGS